MFILFLSYFFFVHLNQLLSYGKNPIIPLTDWFSVKAVAAKSSSFYLFLRILKISSVFSSIILVANLVILCSKS
jgi:hypothetical protein